MKKPLNEEVFTEQAEYLSEKDLNSWNAEHPHEEFIIGKLSGGGAKLISGPRGCGKTTLMRKSLYQVLRDQYTTYFSAYVNFKLSIKMEPLYIQKPYASSRFKMWMIAKIYLGIIESFEIIKKDILRDHAIGKTIITKYIQILESGTIPEDNIGILNADYLKNFIKGAISTLGKTSFILLIDDAAHAFSPKQQEDFFDFFRELRTRYIAPKAAIYPGITTSSGSFHVGHDAEQIDVWISPTDHEYKTFMRALFQKRFDSVDLSSREIKNNLDFLAYCSFGIPRSFLNMIRFLESRGEIDLRTKTKILKASKISRQNSHEVYNALSQKIPSYSNIIEAGSLIYDRILSRIKLFNRGKSAENQALEIGIGKPISPEIQKILSLLQYSGLLMPVDSVSRGEKGIFSVYLVHFGDLVNGNYIIGKKAKVLSDFLIAFEAYSTAAQRWPRYTADALQKQGDQKIDFSLSLPPCPTCGAPRINSEARYCHNCGSELKSPSIYEELVNQDISSLPITKSKVSKIKNNSNIRKIKDIFLDNSREQLRNVPGIGKVWATKIIGYAEEHVA